MAQSARGAWAASFHFDCCAMKKLFLSSSMAAIFALGSASAAASTLDYDKAVASGQTIEGEFARIVIRNDVGLAGSAAFAASHPAFAAVVGLGWSGGQYCTGVLVSPTTVLSARHCDPRVGEFARFGTNFGAPDFQSSITSVLFPAGGNANSPYLNGGDVAILTLGTAVPGSVALPLLLTAETTELVGMDVATLGYGARGVGSGGTGSGGAAAYAGIRLGGTNVLDYYGQAPRANGTYVSGSANIFSTDFDNPTGTSNTLGWLGSNSAATATEATTAGGDSGGPLLVQWGNEWVVAGLLGGGTTSNSVYGDISWWTSVSPYQAMIESYGGVFVTVVPEAGTVVLMLLGLTTVGVVVRRGRRQDA